MSKLGTIIGTGVLCVILRGEKSVQPRPLSPSGSQNDVDRGTINADKGTPN